MRLHADLAVTSSNGGEVLLVTVLFQSSSMNLYLSLAALSHIKVTLRLLIRSLRMFEIRLCQTDVYTRIIFLGCHAAYTVPVRSRI
jgi:hypothetical protein